jgi:hypothetical protein
VCSSDLITIASRQSMCGSPRNLGLKKFGLRALDERQADSNEQKKTSREL